MHRQRLHTSDHTTEHPSSTPNILAAERRFRAIFEQTTVAMAYMNTQGNLQQMNRHFCEMLGYESAELLQQGFLDTTHLEGAQADIAYLRSTLTTSASMPHMRETRYLRKDGSSVWVSLTMSPVYLKNDVLDGVICIIEDISQRKQLEEQLLLSEQLEASLSTLQQTNIRLEQVNTVQSDFIAIVSHEFRTTLTGIQGFSELLRDEVFDVTEVKEYANDINADALRLNRMITKLLDLERLKSGKIGLHLSKIDINRIEEVAERMVLTAPDHTLRLDIDESLPQFEGDDDKLMQLATSLVSNAVKYSPAHSEISLKSGQETNAIHIVVQDQGVGIPQDALEAIFAPDSHIYSAKTHYIQGNGLELAIAQQIVQMHEGRIWVESKPGNGTAFHITLPIKLATHVYQGQ